MYIRFVFGLVIFLQTVSPKGATNQCALIGLVCGYLSDLNLYLNTCGQLQLHKCLDGLGG